MFKETIEIVSVPLGTVVQFGFSWSAVVLIYVNVSVMRMLQLCHSLLGLNLPHLNNLLLLIYTSLSILG